MENPKPHAVRSAPNATHSSSLIFSPRIQSMMQRRSGFASQREFEIEVSKDHWSELESKAAAAPQQAAHMDANKTSKVVKEKHFPILGRFRRTLGKPLFCWQCANCGAFACGVLTCGVFNKSGHHHQQQGNHQLECVELEEAEESDAEETNRDIFESIKEQWGGFFSTNWGENLELGDKIAEGGQAEIFEVEGGLDAIRMEFVVKAFKKGYSLRSLQTQWPLGMSEVGHFNLVNSAIIFAGTVLKDDRFAFVMYKYWGDLRKLIDSLKMDQRGPPFQEHQAVSIMLQIANGMQQLHKKNILHRDLKASNVLIALDNMRKRNPPDPGNASEFSCAIADYECSVGVVGTGFWRAPEVLVAVRDQNLNLDPRTFTQKADVYSFAMTCYEILTGCVPFEDLDPDDYDSVLRGRRPQLPHPMNSRVTELLCRCWHSNPSERPSFYEISSALETVQRTSDLTNTSPDKSNRS